jgi:hypothetical protein
VTQALARLSHLTDSGGNRKSPKGRCVQIGLEASLDRRSRLGHVGGDLIDFTTAALAVVAVPCARRVGDTLPPAVTEDALGGFVR